ncbi:MAG: Gfo/Idh/MocA family oxidoreductase [Armatimonadaceae bacterium]
MPVCNCDTGSLESIEHMTKYDEQTISRRGLLGSGAIALGLLTGAASGLHAEELFPEEAVRPQDAKAAVPVTVAVIGLGDRGREILSSLSYAPGVTVAYVCDTYANAHKKALEIFPKATAVTEYKQVLDDPKAQGVFVATPTHLHKQIVLDALAAGKHVYCEMPLAHTPEDAKGIALAAKAAPKLVFQSGLQYRTNPQHHHVLKFVKTGALARVAQAKAVWHKKTSWRRIAPTDERQRELNWRLDKALSPGLLGEIGVHQIDVASWFLNKLPVAVHGFGGILAWNDGRQVQDTVQAVLEYPGDVHLAYDATLANSFDGSYELFQGTDAAVMLRDVRAWMFKEADARALGWEVYAYKEKIGDETGIALVADATKLLAEGKEPGKNRDTDPRKTPLYFACETFANDIRVAGGAAKSEEDKDWSSGYAEGYTATVVALKANEAVVSGSKIAFTPEMLTI